MKESQKQVIQTELKKLAEMSSQNRVAVKVGISTAACSQIIVGNWGYIGPKTWRSIEAKLRIDTKWHGVPTKNYEGLMALLSAAQDKGLAMGISYDAGAGKSHAYRAYARQHANVILIEAANFWTKKEYVRRLLLEVGGKIGGTISDLVTRFVERVNELHKPIIIIDQFDKLRDPSLDLFMDMYNETHHKCGFILSGVAALEKRVLAGVLAKKMGYEELYSRIGRKFIKLDPLTRRDVKLICLANGLEDEDKIIEIYNTCEGDIRRVRRSVEQYHMLSKRNHVTV